MIRRLLPWAIVAFLLAVAFFVGTAFWRASQLPEDLTASVTDTVDAPVEAVWMVLNTSGVLTERFDEVEFEEVCVTEDTTVSLYRTDVVLHICSARTTADRLTLLTMHKTFSSLRPW